MNEIMIWRILGGYQVIATADGRRYPSRKMYGYTKREALTLYRKHNGLRWRHLVLIDCTKGA